MSEKRFKIVGLGEILFDYLPSNEKTLGGAPANFAYVATQLGDDGIVASRVGRDADGDRIIQQLKSVGVAVDQIQIDETHSTGAVTVTLKNDQPEYEIAEISAWDFLEMTASWRELAESCDAVCFGTLGQRNRVARQTIKEFAGSTRRACLRVFDVNLRQHFFSNEILQESLRLASIVKLNHEELPLVSQMLNIAGSNELELIERLKESFGLRAVCLTRGSRGSLLMAENQAATHIGIKIEVADTVGAGDAFTAAMTHGFLRDWELDKISDFANQIGAFVASQTGAMPQF